jgi:hypothetical protein
MLRPLFLFFCFLHEANRKTLFPNRLNPKNRNATGASKGTENEERDRERER